MSIFISISLNICLCSQKNRLIETVLLSTQTIVLTVKWKIWHFKLILFAKLDLWLLEGIKVTQLPGKQ